MDELSPMVTELLDDQRPLLDLLPRLIASARANVPPQAGPIPMLLFCPKCGAQHIDAPSEGWEEQIHRKMIVLKAELEGAHANNQRLHAEMVENANRATKAEADLERVTRERDDLSRMCGEAHVAWNDEHQRGNVAESKLAAGQATAEVVAGMWWDAENPEEGGNEPPSRIWPKSAMR